MTGPLSVRADLAQFVRFISEPNLANLWFIINDYFDNKFGERFEYAHPNPWQLSGLRCTSGVAAGATFATLPC